MLNKAQTLSLGYTYRRMRFLVIIDYWFMDVTYLSFCANASEAWILQNLKILKEFLDCPLVENS